MTESEIRAILEATADQYPRAWQHAHREGHPERYDFIILAGKRLYAASGGTVGCNWRRAMIGDLSMDGITVQLADGRYYFGDVIIGAGGSNPQIVYRTPGPAALLRDADGNYAPHGFADPRPMKTAFDYSSGPVEPPHQSGTVPYRSYADVGDAFWDRAAETLFADYAEAGQPPDPGMGRWIARTIWDATMGEAPGRILSIEESIAKHRAEWRAILGLP